jgi:hypothetical protein
MANPHRDRKGFECGWAKVSSIAGSSCDILVLPARSSAYDHTTWRAGGQILEFAVLPPAKAVLSILCGLRFTHLEES